MTAWKAANWNAAQFKPGHPEIVLDMVSWLNRLRPWQAFGTFTYRWEGSISSAIRCFTRFMAKEGKGVSYVYAVEPNPGRDGFHLHCLLHSYLEFHRTLMWSAWHKKFGRNRIEPPLQRADTLLYVTKYVFKKSPCCDLWWDVHLVGAGRPRPLLECDFSPKVVRPGLSLESFSGLGSTDGSVC